MAYQYPYGDTQQLNLAWFLDEFKALQEAWEQEKQGITGALDAEIARAEAALSGVIEARDQAAASAADALAYRNAAQSASQAAELSKTNAETARRDASNYAVSAAGYAQNASNSAIAAGNSATLAESAKTTAIQQANAAVQASGTASGYAQSAGQQAANAAGSATTASEAADRAETAADEVADSVTQIATNTSDINSLKESITQSAITNTVSGNPLVIEDAEQNNAIQMNAVTQDTPMDLFIGGENFLDYTKFRNYGDAYGLTVSITQNGVIHITGTYSSKTNPNPQYRLLTVTDAYFRSNVKIKIFDENKENNPVPHLVDMRVQENSNLLIVILENMVYGETYDIAFSIASYITGNNIPTSYIEPTAINISTTVIEGVIQSPIPLYKNKNYITNIGSGDIELSINYFTNTKSYIDTKDNLVKSLIAPVLDDMIADTALTANDFRIVNNTLYRIITSVASGATLTPNTNCIATTITAVLKTLLS